MYGSSEMAALDSRGCPCRASCSPRSAPRWRDACDRTGFSSRSWRETASTPGWRPGQLGQPSRPDALQSDGRRRPQLARAAHPPARTPLLPARELRCRRSVGSGRPYGINGLGEGFGSVFSFLPGRPPADLAPRGEGPDAWHVDVRSDGRPLPFPLYFQIGYTDGLWCRITVRRDQKASEGDVFVRDITGFLEEFHAMLTEEIRAVAG